VLGLEVQQRLAALRVEGRGKVFMHDPPLSVDLAATDGHAEPSSLLFAVFVGPASSAQVMAKGHVIAGRYVQVVSFEGHRAWTHGKTRFPVLSVRLGAFELQVPDGIERQDIRGVTRHDPVDVLGARRFDPTIDQCPNLVR
jgi:hypothetical protein